MTTITQVFRAVYLNRTETNRIDREQEKKAEHNNTRIHFVRTESNHYYHRKTCHNSIWINLLFFSFENCVKYTTIELIRIVCSLYIFMLFDSEVFRFRNTRSHSIWPDEKCLIWHWMAQGTIFILSKWHSFKCSF